MTETTWPIKPKVITIWPLGGKKAYEPQLQVIQLKKILHMLVQYSQIHAQNSCTCTKQLKYKTVKKTQTMSFTPKNAQEGWCFFSV